VGARAAAVWETVSLERPVRRAERVVQGALGRQSARGEDRSKGGCPTTRLFRALRAVGSMTASTAQ
jgi:hypothetical protein